MISQAVGVNKHQFPNSGLYQQFHNEKTEYQGS